MFSSLLCYKNAVIPCITNKIYVNQLFMLLIRLPINSRLLVVKFFGSQSCTGVFNLGHDSHNHVLFEGQLYLNITINFIAFVHTHKVQKSIDCALMTVSLYLNNRQFTLDFKYFHLK